MLLPERLHGLQSTIKRMVQGIALDQKRGCAHRTEGKGSKKNSGDGRKERWFECLAYSISSTLLLCFTASASAVAPGSPMLFMASLHGLQMNTQKERFKG